MATPNRISLGEAIAGKLATNTGVTFGDGSYQYLASNRYWGQFFDTTTQTIASTTTAYPVALSNADATNFGITLTNGNRITFQNHGIYNIQFSIQFANAEASINFADVWFAKNGTNIADSNSQIDVPAKHGSLSGKAILALNCYVEADAGEYVQILWAGSGTELSIATLNATTSPTRPRTPSAIVTVNKVDQP